MRGGEHMTRSEIALQLALSAIEKGNLIITDSSNESLGDQIAVLFNRIYRGLDAHCGSDS